MDLVSVIMPTYRNTKDDLIRAINSILSQTYKNIELLIIDDNVELYFTEILCDLIKELDNGMIRYIKNDTNIGSAKSRNIGILNSKGLYITFLDADDMYLPTKIEKQYLLMHDNDADYSIMNLKLYNEQEKLVRIRNHNYLLKSNDLFKLHLKYHLTGTDCIMFKKNYLLNIGMFDEIDQGDEFYLMMKAIEHDGKFSYLPEYLVKAYVHNIGTGLTAGASKISGENSLFEYKQKHFAKLSKLDISYIKTRHYLVLFSVYFKNKNYYKSIQSLYRAFFSNPLSFSKFLIKRKEF